ncbi:hypothetical protein BJP50_24555 [Paenibacillus odorifer]|nr:hypothetical protein BJP50_24555 [Paenibacillus odorifer]
MVTDVEFGKEIENAISWAKGGWGRRSIRCVVLLLLKMHMKEAMESKCGEAAMHANPQSCTMRTRIPGFRQLARLFFMLVQVWWTVSLRIGGM